MRGEPSETARPAVVALVQKLCSNERAAPRRSSAQRAAPPPSARVRRRRAAGVVLQGRPASSSARAHGQAELFQLVSIISDACSATELMKRVHRQDQSQTKPMRRGCGGAELTVPPETLGTLDQSAESSYVADASWVSRRLSLPRQLCQAPTLAHQNAAAARWCSETTHLGPHR